jgi:hypothetical protein
MEPGESIRRPSEVITSLRQKAFEKQQKHVKGAIRVGANARYCPAGHCFARTLVSERRRTQPHRLTRLPPIACHGCLEEIEEDGISGSCKTCDIDFCKDCFESGRPIEEMLKEGRDSVIVEASTSTLGEITWSPTEEYCAAGHQLGRVCSTIRRRHLQEKNGLSSPPTIECDCCSKEITNDIAGCCLECDIDFCETCFCSGQSFEDILEHRSGPEEEESRVNGKRYDGRRPTYKDTGRVSYDFYPDPTVFQWTFTGSCESKCVEYFEKDFARLGVIKLDFYYSRGTVKTTLEHPTKGEKRLFGKGIQKVSSKLYKKIVQDPRTHTDRRYRKDREQSIQ